MGSLSLLTADDGRLSVGPFSGEIASRGDARPDARAEPRLPAELRSVRRRGVVARPQHDAGLPLGRTSRAVDLRVGTGKRLDGVLVADPFAVRELLRVTGP